MKYIQIKGKYGGQALVDDTEYNRLSKYNWWCNEQKYPTRHHTVKPKHYTKIYMHREITNAEKGQEIDHINGNTFDNRKDNLRIISSSNNKRNSRRLWRNNTSGYRGVYWHKQQKKWMVYISIGKKYKHLGLFKDKLDAAKVAERFYKDNYGDYLR